MVDQVTGADAWSAIAPIVGGAGISGVIIAVIGYLSAARGGRRGEPDKAAGAVGISALLGDSESITRLSVALQSVALAADKIALLTIENRQEWKDEIPRMMKLAHDFYDEFRELRRAVDDIVRRRVD